MTVNVGIFDNMPNEVSGMSDAAPGFHLLRTRTKTWPIRLATFVIITIVLTAPIPLASNHPLAWLFWAIILGASGSVVAAFCTLDKKTNVQTQVLLSLAVVFIGWTVFQALPLPGLRGGLPVQLPSGRIIFHHLSIAPAATFLAAIRLISYLIFFWLMLIVSRRPNRARSIGCALFYGVALHAAVAIIALKLLGDINLIAEKIAFKGMATGTFVNKNSFATFLGMGLVLGLSLHLKSPELSHRQMPWQGKKIQRLSLSIIVVALLLTQSRMGIVATFTAALFIILRSRPIPKLWPAITFAILIIASGIAAIGLNGKFVDLNSSANSRFELYKQVFQLIAYRPLTGFGIDSFPLAFELFHAPGVTAGFIWDKAHSTYLTLWAEGGLLFGSIPIVVGLLAGIQLWQRSNAPCPGKSMALAGVAVTLLVALHSLVDFSLEMQANTFLFLAIIALGLGPNQPPKGKT